MAEAANEAGKAPPTYVCDILVETDLGVSFVSQSTSSEESLAEMLAHDLATHGSDGLCIGSQRHPRTFGSFARVLGDVRARAEGDAAGGRRAQDDLGAGACGSA